MDNNDNSSHNSVVKPLEGELPLSVQEQSKIEPGVMEDTTENRSNRDHSSADLRVPVLTAENSGDLLEATTAAGSNNYEASNNRNLQPPGIFKIVSLWTKFTQWLRNGISQFVLTLSLLAARNPKSCISLLTVLSFSLITIGYFTNFSVDVSEEEMFAPYGGNSREYVKFVRNFEGFTKLGRFTVIMIHADGDNVISYEAMDRLFRVVDAVESRPLYRTVCPNDGDCEPDGPISYWDKNATLFREQTKGSDEAVFAAISVDFYPTGKPAFQELMMGGVKRDSHRNITFAQSFFMGIGFPAVGDMDATTLALELEIIDRLLTMREAWKNEPGNPYKLEFHAIRSIPDEMMRAISKDIPLIPLVFVIMTLFTCLIFYRHDKVQSRSLLGVGSIVTIVMSMMTGYGIVFIAGIPFTSMTQILPFVIFGVGLDDTFIITGAYFRTDLKKDAVERVRETMEEVGASISLTTITTTAAFCLGCISTIPSIQWLCIYASLAIFVDFCYQITFFVALVVLDERRVQANRRDCCFCLVVDPNEPFKDTSETHKEDSETRAIPSTRTSTLSTQQTPLVDRFMDWYANQLLRPAVKILVLVGFAAFLGGCSYSATKLIQEFQASDFLPEDSYASSFLYALENYFDQSLRFPVYFRNVDQSDPEVQEQMIQYIDALVGIPAFGAEPDFCWVKDFRRLASGEIEGYEDYEWIFNSNLTFAQQLDLILSDPNVGSVYSGDIARDEDGNIEVSRCPLSVKNLDMNVVQEQINFMADIVKVTTNQTINQGAEGGQEPFFAFDLIFFLWEFYTLATEELKSTTISGIVTVSAIGFLLIPHWSAVLFVAPLIVVLYIDLLGTLQFSGLHINPLTYVCLVLSIGLLVDFNVHILLRYYESNKTTREGKVKDTLRTMGASILVGALSTCLGVVPLAFSSSEVLRTVFVSFIAMVTLGIGHGVILLPVVLALCGPTTHQVVPNSHSYHQEDDFESKDSCKSSTAELLTNDDAIRKDAAAGGAETGGLSSPNE